MKNPEKEYWQSIWNKFHNADHEAFKTNFNEFIDVLFAYRSKITSNTSLTRIVHTLELYCNISSQFDNPFKGSIKSAGVLNVTVGQNEIFEYLSTHAGLDFIKLNMNKYVTE